MIGKSGERGSGISVLPARHDDDDDGLQSFKSVCPGGLNKGVNSRFCVDFRVRHEMLLHIDLLTGQLVAISR